MTVTIACAVCGRPHLATIAAAARYGRCPFCGAGLTCPARVPAQVAAQAPVGRCVDCDEPLAEHGRGSRCGFCLEEAAA